VVSVLGCCRSSFEDMGLTQGETARCGGLVWPSAWVSDRSPALRCDGSYQLIGQSTVARLSLPGLGNARLLIPDGQVHSKLDWWIKLRLHGEG
jgi:hypothetical protein